MNSLLNFWKTLTEPQATLISSLSTVLSAFILTVLGPKILRRTVKGIEDARDKALQAAESITTKFQGLREEIQKANEVISSVQWSVNTFRGRQAQDEEESQPAAEKTPDQERLETLKNYWTTDLQPLLEQIASSTYIDGRSRAKYARVDRRNYPGLIDALDNDGNLLGPKDEWKNAYALYKKYIRRSGATPSPQELELMKSLTDHLKGLKKAWEEMTRS